MNPRKTLKAILAGSRNIRFRDFTALVEAFGFKLARMSGSHYIFVHPQVEQLINLQNVDGQVKPYQMLQFLRMVEKYRLQLEDRP
jgi:predicted RNA binding protein YcfA (HicA-like mRNA interferase family)